jgi:hypothetical protein
MSHYWKLAALAAGCTLMFAAAAYAQEQSVVVEPQPVPPAEQPTLAPPAEPTLPPPAAKEEIMPAPAATQAVVQPTPPIVYHTGLRARRMFRCQDQVKLVMVTKNPADCCLYEIPLCVPACCEGQPSVREGRGIFGRGVVEYCWPCGFSAKVKFRRVLCDVKVDYSA